MKVVFVGIHNKKGMKPLDSRSLTGRIIDMVISRIGNVETEKTNLFPTDYMPMHTEKWIYLDQLKIDGNALYVGLGKIVNDQLVECHHHLPVHHPGYVIRKGKGAIKEYVKSVSEKITEYITKTAVHTNCARCGVDVIATRKEEVYCDRCIEEWLNINNRTIIKKRFKT